MNYFCTYCDQGYVARLLCLHDSLRAQGEPFQLHVLCFDAKTRAVVESVGQPSLVAVSVDEVLQADPAYAAVRGQRSRVEFYFTSTPVFVRYCFSRETSAERFTYLDSDLYFFGSANAVLAQQGTASIGIVPHRFPARLSEFRKWGTYNVAWVSFRRDVEGLAGLEWWRERCLEWCQDQVVGERYADQGYLDEFPRRWRSVRALDHAGINAAPWNIAEARIASRDGRVYIDEEPLLFYHFQGIREVMPGWFDPGLRTYRSKLTRELCDLIYLPYVKHLVATQQRLQAEFGIAPRLGYQRLTEGKSLGDRWQRFAVQRLLPTFRRLRGQLIHCPEGQCAPKARGVSIPAT